MTHPAHAGPAPEDDGHKGTDPIRNHNPLVAAANAQRLAVDALATERGFCADTIALTVQHATIAVKLHEELDNGGAVSLQHLLAFFSDEDYRARVLALASDPAAEKTRPVVGADWLPEESRSFFTHIFYGAWTSHVRNETASAAALALTLADQREIIKGGD